MGGSSDASQQEIAEGASLASEGSGLILLLFFLFFGTDGGFSGLKAGTAVSTVAEWLIHGPTATAQREIRFSGEIIFVAVGVDEFDGAFGGLHAEGSVFSRHDFDLCH